MGILSLTLFALPVPAATKQTMYLCASVLVCCLCCACDSACVLGQIRGLSGKVAWRPHIRYEILMLLWCAFFESDLLGIARRPHSICPQKVVERSSLGRRFRPGDIVGMTLANFAMTFEGSHTATRSTFILLKKSSRIGIVSSKIWFCLSVTCVLCLVSCALCLCLVP